MSGNEKPVCRTPAQGSPGDNKAPTELPTRRKRDSTHFLDQSSQEQELSRPRNNGIQRTSGSPGQNGTQLGPESPAVPTGIEAECVQMLLARLCHDKGLTTSGRQTAAPAPRMDAQAAEKQQLPDMLARELAHACEVTKPGAPRWEASAVC